MCGLLMNILSLGEDNDEPKSMRIHTGIQVQEVYQSHQHNKTKFLPFFELLILSIYKFFHIPFSLNTIWFYCYMNWYTIGYKKKSFIHLFEKAYI